MKKIISIALGLLVAFPAFAGTVSIGSLSVLDRVMSASGSASYGEEDTLTVSLRGVTDLINGGTDTAWNVSKSLLPGNYTLDAKVGDASDSRNFNVPAGGGLSPCQTQNTCPDFGKFAPTIPDQNVKVEHAWKFVNPGESGCPSFFTSQCFIKG